MNPFTSMLLTFDPTRFYGRENEIVAILQVVTARETSGHAIYGIRTIGKTTLLKFLKAPGGAMHRYERYINAEFAAGAGRQLLQVYISFHVFSAEDNLFSVLLENLIEELEDNVVLASNISLPHWEDQLSRQEAINALKHILREIHQYGVRVVFLLDDFEVPLQFLDEDDDRLLRTLSDVACLIIATERPISELRPDIGESSPLLGILRPEAIGLLTDDAARDLMTGPVTPKEIFTREEQDFLISAAGKQPFLLITACELYYTMRREFPEITTLVASGSSLIERQFIQRLMGLPHVYNVMYRIWLSLTRDEQTTLTHMMNDQVQNTTLAAGLINKALVFMDFGRGKNRVYSLLFGEFIRQQEQQNMPSLYDMADNLSPIDRKLFQYFLQRPNQVCTFDELLDAVWTDADKSKRALEAAVHRLRQHLEDSPEQISNVRGKGYKFISKAVV